MADTEFPESVGSDSTTDQPEASGRFPVERNDCPCGCGRPVPPHSRGSEPKWATGNCRRRAADQRKYGQGSLDLEPQARRTYETGKTTRLRNDLLALLRSGSKEWTPGDLTRALGATWAAISPRLRDLRKPGFGGWNIQSRVLDKHNGSWRWTYWLHPTHPKREVE